MANAAHPPFVGRRRELSLLREQLDAARTGQGGVALIGGEPGIGKTRLALELAAQARAQGWLVLSGRAAQPEGMPPYLPFTEALRDYVRACPPDDLRTHLGKGAAEAALLLPDLHDRLPDLPPSPPLPPDYLRYRLFESITDFVIAIARSSAPGLLLLLDDLHAADQPSLLLFHHLVRRLAAAPLLVVATHRPVEPDGPEALQNIFAEINRDAAATLLPLAPLPLDAVHAMVEGMAGGPAAPPVTRALHLRTGGNPLFVREMVRHLQAEARDLTDARTVEGDWGVPDSIRHLIGRRLARLTPETVRALSTAAVLGDGFSFEVLAAALPLDDAPLLDAVEEALRAGVLREEGGRFAFSHPLVRETLYDALSLPRRQRLHVRAAEAIEHVHRHTIAPHLAAVATHYRLAGAAADPATVLSYVERAGTAAAAVFAWEEAAAHWSTAVRLLQEMTDATPEMEVRRCTLLVELGRALGRAGDAGAARGQFREAAALARRRGASVLLAEAALGYAEVYTTGSDVDLYLVGLLEEALSTVDPGEGRLRAPLLAALAMALRYAPNAERRTSLVRSAVALARREENLAALPFALSALQVANWQPDNVAERLEAATEAVRLAEVTGNRDLACWAHHWRAVNLLEVGDIDALDVELEAHRRLAEDLRAPYYIWNSLRLRATRAIMGGAIAEGERLAQQALETGRRLDPIDAHAMYTTQIWNIRLWQGRLADLVDAWERYCDYYAAIPAWRARLAWLYAEIGRDARARQELDRLAAGRFAALPREMHWLSAMTFLAEACVYLGDAEHAATLYELLLPYAGYNVRSGGYPVSLACFGSASRPLGKLAATLGDWTAAAAHFQDAIAMNTRMRAWPWVARAQQEYAEMLLAHHARGDLQHTRALLGEALTLYERLGIERYAAQVRAALAAPRPVAAGGYPDRLTPREVDVLRLIAAGRSNREIAAVLVLSERTVERHIANIYEKIGVHGRSARAAAATYALVHHVVEPAEASRA